MKTESFQPSLKLHRVKILAMALCITRYKGFSCYCGLIVCRGDVLYNRWISPLDPHHSADLAS